MIFAFPNLESLRIALATGQVPPEVAAEPAEAAVDPTGRWSVEPRAEPPPSMLSALERLGIGTVTAHSAPTISVGCWLEIIPVVKQSGTLEIGPATPVLFDMPADLLADFAGEMLRLGNDRLSARTIANASESRVLLRVIGPPYFTLLRALDRLDAGVFAYVEHAPRVWVEAGHTHHLAANMKVAEGQVLLLRPPRRWTMMDDGPFQDIYEVFDFVVPRPAIVHREARLENKPYIYRLSNAIERDLKAIERMQAYETRHKVNLSSVLKQK